MTLALVLESRERKKKGQERKTMRKGRCERGTNRSGEQTTKGQPPVQRTREIKINGGKKARFYPFPSLPPPVLPVSFFSPLPSSPAPRILSRYLNTLPRPRMTTRNADNSTSDCYVGCAENMALDPRSRHWEYLPKQLCFISTSFNYWPLEQTNRMKLIQLD